MGRNRFTRPVVLATVAAALIVAGMPRSAHAGPDGPPSTAGTCDSKALTMLFWPEGHPAIPEFNFPEFLVAHVEVYTTTNLVEENSAAYVGADGAGGVAPICTETADVAPKQPKSPKTERETAALVCRFDKDAGIQVETGDGTEAPRISVLQSRKVVGATATVSETGARVVYNKKLCKVRPAPPEGP